MARPFVNPRPARKGLWFPLILAGLLLLAVPGMVFLALSLLGLESRANAVMQGAAGVSYHIPVPWWAELLLLLMPFLIVLLYFLKMKRRLLQVPSTYLWKKSIEDLHVNSLFQWMRDNVLLFVQLLIVLILIYGVLSLQVHFRVPGAGATAKHYILLIDNSASMQVADAAGGTRLDAAKKAALDEIDGYGEDDAGMVIEFNSGAVIRQPYTADRDKLRAAVREIDKTERVTRLDEALRLAESLANPLKSTDNQAVAPADADPSKARTYVSVEGVAADVHVFSDGRFSDVADFAAGNLDINYHRIGQEGNDDNLGIVTLNARRDDKDPARMAVFVGVLNFRTRDLTVRVELEERKWNPKTGQLELIDRHEQSVTLKAREVAPADPANQKPAVSTPGEGSTIFELNDVDDDANRVLHAHLIDAKDQFPLDDDAWLVVGVVRKARVLIVTEGDDILHVFFDLDATRKVADVTYLTPAELKDEAKYIRPARDGVFDLVIFDRCAPKDKDGKPDEDALPRGNTFFIDDVPPPWNRADMPKATETQIRNPTSKDALMRNLTGLDEIAFVEAFRFELDPAKDPRVPARAPRLMETDKEGAVLFALPRRSYTDLVLAFPLVNKDGQWTSNWNLKLSFPLFLRNVLYTLGHVSDAAAEEALQPGQMKILRPQGAVKDEKPTDKVVTEIQVTDPTGATQAVPRNLQNEFLYKDTDHLGPYQATWEGGRRGFAVNLLDADESDIQPRDEVQIGDRPVKSGPSAGRVSDLWPLLAVAALLLLLLEWAAYHFRVFG